MALSDSVNSMLSKMHAQKVPSDKGPYGEKAVLAICEDIYHRRGGILVLSYTYRTVDGLAGNIKRDGSKLYVENLGTHTEIDVLLVTKNRIFPIEVKAYKANSITLNNDRITGSSNTSKSPEHQNEMHCRHLYPHIFTAIPDGIAKYIIPIVVFVDETKVFDKRTDDHKDYIKVTVLNQLRSLIEMCDKPLNNTQIDLQVMETKLRSAMISCEKFFPYNKK